jgi:hypothetical protein
LLELSGETVPEKEQPALDPVTLPLELMTTVVDIPSNNVPLQLPEISDNNAGVL